MVRQGSLFSGYSYKRFKGQLKSFKRLHDYFKVVYLRWKYLKVHHFIFIHIYQSCWVPPTDWEKWSFFMPPKRLCSSSQPLPSWVAAKTQTSDIMEFSFCFLEHVPLDTQSIQNWTFYWGSFSCSFLGDSVYLDGFWSLRFHLPFFSLGCLDIRRIVLSSCQRGSRFSDYSQFPAAYHPEQICSAVTMDVIMMDGVLLFGVGWRVGVVKALLFDTNMLILTTRVYGPCPLLPLHSGLYLVDGPPQPSPTFSPGRTQAPCKPESDHDNQGHGL